MNVVEEFQSLSRQVTELQRNENRKLAEQKIRELVKLMRQRNAAFKKEMEQLHAAARLVTSQSKTATLAAAVWKELSENLSIALLVLTKIPRPHPEVARLVEESQVVVRDLIDNAEQECRSYHETAHLLGSKANTKRLREAIEEANSGTLPVFESTEDLLKSLHER